VLQLGTFGSPARLSDVSGLTLDRDDAEHLARCRPRHCDIQLSSGAMERFRDTLAGDEGNLRAADEVMRSVLVDLVNEYRQSGDAALMTYTDSDHPLSAAAQFRKMIATPPRFLDQFPSLNAHMLRYPSSGSDEVDDVIYWSKAKLGPSVVVTVTHLGIERVHDGSPVAFAAASRQLYGTHYFDASLGLTVLVDRGPDCILVYANRSRLDALGGFFGGIKRAIVRSRARSAMARNLTEAREQAERRYTSRGE
jgi:hypothetical protein